MKNMKKTVLLFYVLIFSVFAFAQQVRPVKNVIVMIPDGTSIGVYSAARWYKMYNKLGDALNVDPYITGTVTTFSSNAPIGDSAPTSSAYATGVLQQSGNGFIVSPIVMMCREIGRGGMGKLAGNHQSRRLCFFYTRRLENGCRRLVGS